VTEVATVVTGAGNKKQFRHCCLDSKNPDTSLLPGLEKIPTYTTATGTWEIPFYTTATGTWEIPIYTTATRTPKIPSYAIGARSQKIPLVLTLAPIYPQKCKKTQHSRTSLQTRTVITYTTNRTHSHKTNTEGWKHPHGTPLWSNNRHQHIKWQSQTQLTINGCVKNA